MRGDLTQLAGARCPRGLWTRPDGGEREGGERAADGAGEWVCRLDLGLPELRLTWLEWAAAVGSARAGGSASDAGRGRLSVPGVRRKPTLQQVLDRWESPGRRGPRPSRAPAPWWGGRPCVVGGGAPKRTRSTIRPDPPRIRPAAWPDPARRGAFR